MNGIWVVFAKEVLESLRDRRSVFSALLFGPLFGPLLFVGMLGSIANVESERNSQTLVLPVLGSDHAPSLIGFLESQGVRIEPPPENPTVAVEQRQSDVVLVISADYRQRFQAAYPAPVRLIYDRSRRSAQATVQRVQGLLERYSRTIGVLRLQARGIDPNVIRALTVIEEDLATPESHGAALLVMLPCFMMMSLFIGGMYLAIDTTAGERERGSMEALLITPLPRWALMVGKLAATTLFALCSLALTLVMFALSLRWVPLDSLGVPLYLGPYQLVLLFAISASLALLAATLQTLIATFSRGFREAQTYVSLLVLVTLVPSLIQLISPLQPTLALMTIPLLSQNLLIDQIIRQESLDPVAVTVAVTATLLVGLVLAWGAAQLYRREQLLYSA